MSKEITAREQDYAQWYNDLIIKGSLADYSAVRGCMVIKPYGFALWENMRDALDKMFKDTGHVNAYFPLFIPKSFLSKEAAHVEGFAKECAVVTHYRLKNDPNGGGVIVDPEAKLEEELIVRPTSETIIYSMFAKWVQSYRDLPLLINQWANVVRWEMRTRLFLRTLEFLWQEGHTAHATNDEAEEEARRMLGVYRTFMEGWMAMPVITGQKTDSERFAGAVRTYSCEAMMQDNKALQAGTSHNLGQNFARAFELKFQTEAGGTDFAWNTSWGVSTRMIGGLVMTHGDDKGLRVPPLLAPIEIVIVPIYRSDEDRARVLEAATRVKAMLGDWKRGEHGRVRVHVDARDGMKPGAKYYEWELRGIPLRMELGPRDIDANQAVLVRRDSGEKRPVSLDGLGATVQELLERIQSDMFAAARERLEANSVRGDLSWDGFKEIVEGKGGFIFAGWCGSAECEAKIKEETKATIRVLPDAEFRSAQAPASCVRCGNAATAEALWAKAY